jgi:hypothetical protein
MCVPRVTWHTSIRYSIDAPMLRRVWQEHYETPRINSTLCLQIISIPIRKTNWIVIHLYCRKFWERANVGVYISLMNVFKVKKPVTPSSRNVPIHLKSSFGIDKHVLKLPISWRTFLLKSSYLLSCSRNLPPCWTRHSITTDSSECSLSWEGWIQRKTSCFCPFR